MALKRKCRFDVLLDEDDLLSVDDNKRQLIEYTPSFFTKRNIRKLKTGACYEYLQKLFDEINISQSSDCNDDVAVHKICIKQIGKALLFNSNPDDNKRLICYDYPVNIVKDYSLSKYECFLFVEYFLTSLNRRYNRPDFLRVQKKYRKPNKLFIDINKNHFNQTMYLWIRDKFGLDLIKNSDKDDKKERNLPLTIQHSYHNSFVLSMRNMYEDAIMCFLGYSLTKVEFCPINNLNHKKGYRTENFLNLCSKIIPDTFNLIIYCAIKTHLEEEKRNIFFTQMLDFCKYISNFGQMEKDVLISCIFSVLTYDLHFRPEIIYEKYREIEIKDNYRVRSCMLKYNAFLNISLFLKWKDNEKDFDKMPVFLFEQLKDIVKDGNIIEYMPVFEAFIYLVCKFDLLSDNFYLILNAVQKCPTVIPRIVKRLYQENQPHFAKIIKHSLEPSTDLHHSHESWITYLEYRSAQINKHTNIEELFEDIKIIVRLLDYGKWRKSSKVWNLFNEYLFENTKSTSISLLKENFKDLFEVRRNWWFKFHSVKLSSNTNIIRSKILKFISDLYNPACVGERINE